MKKSLLRRVKELYQAPAVRFARIYRRRLRHTHVVGITGSCGKTSAKDFTAAVLSERFAGRKSYDTTNNAYSVARTLLATRPSHGFCVQEVGAFRPGAMDPAIAALQPTIAVMTMIGSDHVKSFRGPEAVALEKRKLVDALPADGTAVLNADDPRIADIAAQAKVRVLTFGRSESADLRADHVVGRYPDRLGFDVVYGDERVHVQTQLLGEHLLTSLLAAIAVGVVAGVPLDMAARALGRVPASEGRMQLVETPGGPTFIDDSYKASYWSLGAVFEFLRTARAERTWLVLGTVADHEFRRRKLYRMLVEQALGNVDHLVCIGQSAHYAPESDGRVHTFERVQEADEFLHAELRRGDLVLVKGSNRADHLARLVLSHLQPVTCWREACGLSIHCSACRLLAR
ncbi:hypothetical protein BH24PSE2_BH24PSE2_11670 [soil metagenome]